MPKILNRARVGQQLINSARFTLQMMLRGVGGPHQQSNLDT